MPTLVPLTEEELALNGFGAQKPEPKLVPLTPEELRLHGFTGQRQSHNTALGDVVDAAQAGLQNAGASVFEGLHQVTGFGVGPRDALSTMAQQNVEGMSPAAQTEMQKPMFTGDTLETFQPNKDISWQGAGLKVAQGMGSFVPSLLAGGVGGKVAGLGLKAAGLGEKAAGVGGSSLGFGATNALMTGGDAAQQGRAEFLNNPDAWNNDPRSADTMLDPGNPYTPGMDATKVAEDVASKAFWPTAGVGFLSGAVLGPIQEASILGKGSSMLAKGAGGLGSEASQEAIESGAQQYFVNQAMQPLDGRDPMQGVLPAAAEGAAIGGLTGGVAGAASGAVGKGLHKLTSEAPEASDLNATPTAAPAPRLTPDQKDLAARYAANLQALTEQEAYATEYAGKYGPTSGPARDYAERVAHTKEGLAQLVADAKAAGFDPTTGEILDQAKAAGMVMPGGPRPLDPVSGPDGLDAVERDAKRQPRLTREALDILNHPVKAAATAATLTGKPVDLMGEKGAAIKAGIQAINGATNAGPASQAFSAPRTPVPQPALAPAAPALGVSAAPGQAPVDLSLQTPQVAPAAPAADPWANSADWVVANLKPLAERAEQNGVADKVTALAAQYKTTKEIAATLGADESVVQAVKIARGIPSWTTAKGWAGAGGEDPEFTTWRQNYLAGQSQPTESKADNLRRPTAATEAPGGTNLGPQDRLGTPASVQPAGSPMHQESANPLKKPLADKESTWLKQSLGKEGIPVTHDSPIRHEGKFDWRAHIGKGEGNAAFGAGTYLSTSQGVHEGYKEQFSNPRDDHPHLPKVVADNFYTVSTQAAGRQGMPGLKSAAGFVEEVLNRSGNTPIYGEQLRRLAIEEAAGWDEGSGEYANEIAALKAAPAKAFEEPKGGTWSGNAPTYQGRLNVKPEELLDWDAPLSEQSEQVRKALEGAGHLTDPAPDNESVIALRKLGGELAALRSGDLKRISAYFANIKEPVPDADGVEQEISDLGWAESYYQNKLAEEQGSGQSLYADLTEKLGSQAKASDYLQKLGIVGHIYNAAGGKKEDFRNYVVYDDNRIENDFVSFQDADRDPAFDETIGITRGYLKRWSKALGVSMPKLGRDLPGNKTHRAEYLSDAAAVRISDKTAADLTGRNGTIKQVAAVETLAHEFGHHIHEQYLTGASKEEREAVAADYRAWKDSRDASRPTAALLSRTTPARGVVGRAAALQSLKKGAQQGKMPDSFDPEYAFSFQEWTADNVARYIMQREFNAPLSAKSKGVIARIGEKIKAIYREFADAVKKLGKPAPSIEQFLEGYRMQAAKGDTSVQERHNMDARPGQGALMDRDWDSKETRGEIRELMKAGRLNRTQAIDLLRDGNKGTWVGLETPKKLAGGYRVQIRNNHDGSFAITPIWGSSSTSYQAVNKFTTKAENLARDIDALGAALNEYLESRRDQSAQFEYPRADAVDREFFAKWKPAGSAEAEASTPELGDEAEILNATQTTAADEGRSASEDSDGQAGEVESFVPQKTVMWINGAGKRTEIKPSAVRKGTWVKRSDADLPTDGGAMQLVRKTAGLPQDAKVTVNGDGTYRANLVDYKVARHTDKLTGERVFVAYPAGKDALSAYEGEHTYELVDVGANRVALRETTTPASVEGSADTLTPEFVDGILQEMWKGEKGKRDDSKATYARVDTKRGETWIDLPTVTRIGSLLDDRESVVEDRVMKARDHLLAGLAYLQDQFGITLAKSEAGLAKGQILTDNRVIDTQGTRWGDVRGISERFSADEAAYKKMRKIEAGFAKESGYDKQRGQDAVRNMKRAGLSGANATQSDVNTIGGTSGGLTKESVAVLKKKHVTLRPEPTQELEAGIEGGETAAFNLKGAAEGASRDELEGIRKDPTVGGPVGIKEGNEPAFNTTGRGKALSEAKKRVDLLKPTTEAKRRASEADRADAEPGVGSRDIFEQERLRRQLAAEESAARLAQEERRLKATQAVKASPETRVQHRAQIAIGSTTITDQIAALVDNLVRDTLGVTSNIHLADEAGLDAMVQRARGEYAKIQATLKAGTKTAKSYAGKDQTVPLTAKDRSELTAKAAVIAEMGRAMKEAKASGKAHFLAFDTFKRADDRKTVVFLPNKPAAERMTDLFHELGHHLQHEALDAVIAEVIAAETEAGNLIKAAGDRVLSDVALKRKMINELFGVDLKAKLSDVITTEKWIEAQEKFADQLKAWIDSKKRPANVIERIFQGVSDKLRALWNRMKSAVGATQSFEGFMDALMARKEGIKAKTPLGRQYLQAFGTEGKWSSSQREAITVQARTPGKIDKLKAQIFLKDAKKATVDLLHAVSKVWSTPGAELDRLGLQIDGRPLSSYFRVRPGEKSYGPTIPEQMQQHSAEFYNRLANDKDGLYRQLPQEGSAEYQELAEGLVLQLPLEKFSPAVRPIATQIRQYLDDLHAKFTALGMAVDKRRNYFSLVADKAKWVAERPQVIKIIADVLQQEHGRLPRKMAEEQAVVLHQKIALSDGLLFDLDDHGDGGDSLYESIFGPGFRFGKKRSMSDAMHRALKDYYVQDLAAIMNNYTHSGFKRAIFQKELGGLNSSGKYDPAWKINLALVQASQGTVDALPQISGTQLERVRKVLLPALLGTLGQREIPPAIRAAQSIIMLGLNVALLPLSVISSFVELGQIDVRTGKYGLRDIITGKNFAAMRQIFKMMRNKGEYGKLNRLAHAIGSIRYDLLEHVLGNSMDPMYQIPLTQKLNDRFFTAIGQKAWTDMTRVVGLGVAKDALREYAANPKQFSKELDELGATADEIREWFNDGESVDLSRHEAAITALNRWVDGALIRPGATQRPAWGSDPRFALVWHLKDFMWGFHETVMRRVLSQTGDYQNIGKALPFIMLGGALLPLAMVGAELRKWLTDDLPADLLGMPTMKRELHGGEYWLDMIDRAGAIGPFQILLDMDDAAEHGKLAVLSAAGPAISKFQDFLLEDLDVLNALAKTLPGTAQSPVLRNALFGH